MTVSALVPVYNEEATIEELIGRLIAVPVVSEIIAVDDGSTDRTAKILADLAETHGPRLKMIAHAKNRGKGAAVRSALAAATGSHVIVQDGDLEYAPEEIETLVACVSEGRGNAVYGSRFLDRSRSRFPFRTHFLGNRFLTLLCNWASGGRLRLTDMATCYKLVPRRLMESLELEQEGFGFDPELTLKIARQGKSIRECPVSYHGRGRGAGKKLRWRDGVLYLRCVWRYRVKSCNAGAGSPSEEGPVVSEKWDRQDAERTGEAPCEEKRP